MCVCVCVYVCVCVCVYFLMRISFAMCPNQKHCCCFYCNIGCKCDKMESSWTFDEGSLRDRQALPISQLIFTLPQAESEAKFTLGPLMCFRECLFYFIIPHVMILDSGWSRAMD